MLNQFRLFMQMQQSYEAPAAETTSTPGPQALGPVHPTIVTTPTPAAQNNTTNLITSSSTSSQTVGRLPPITPYQSVRPSASSVSSQTRTTGLLPSASINTTGIGSLYVNGPHDSGLPANIPAPPLGMGPGTGLGASFLGFQQRTGQANQARLAAAAQHLPRRPVLQNRRHHLNALSAPSSSQMSSALSQSRPARRSRGPASQRPHAHRQHPELSDVAYSPSGQGEPTHCHIRVKVLPDCGVRFQELYFDSSLINSQ